MNTALWIIQVFLSIMMLTLGYMKTFYPVAQLANFSWTTRSSEGFVRSVGISEILIGAGLVLPELTGILPELTSYAALALAMIMVLAIAEHIRNKEAKEIWKNLLIILLAGLVAVGRFVY
ncbi:MAG: DoxX family protein [Flavitalea sp.]